jgi:hypothetical protein
VINPNTLMMKKRESTFISSAALNTKELFGKITGFTLYPSVLMEICLE